MLEISRPALFAALLACATACNHPARGGDSDASSAASARAPTLAESDPAQRCSELCRTRTQCPAMAGLYNPLPPDEIEKILERQRARYRALEPECVRSCARVSSSRLAPCVSELDKQLRSDAGVICEAWFSPACTNALPEPTLPAGTFGTCVRSDDQCVEYRGHDDRNPIAIAKHCEDMGTPKGTYSTSGCPTKDLLGTCASFAGTPHELRIYRYRTASGTLTAAKAKRECQGTWLSR